MESSPADILRSTYERVSSDVTRPIVTISDIAEHIETVSRSATNRACARVLLACSLAKSSHPEVDIRKPYTEIGDSDAFAGRSYDERYVQPFIIEHQLPCNPTTAFLTPAFRNRNITLTPDLNMVGRPPLVYKATLQLLTDVSEGRISAGDLLAETVRRLLIMKDEQLAIRNSLLADLKSATGALPLSSEDIVTIIEQHLRSANASRLPVLVVAAAYEATKDFLGERILPLEGHNAADKQTQSLGDVHITLIDDDEVVTVYEMKAKRVTQNDLDIALLKINRSKQHRKIDNFIIITTDEIEEQVKIYAASLYTQTGGIEFVVLDCLGFLRHFLHLFHRIRLQFLDSYQRLLLEEPDSAIRQALKDLFLMLRLTAETAYASDETASSGPVSS
jgi:DNA adenine methylase